VEDGGRGPGRAWRGPIVLAYGFRVLFPLAALYAVVAIPAYLLLLRGHGMPFDRVPAITWHAHEMLYGYTAAALGGFLLTAVPNWTSAPPVRGWRLLALALIWLAGRIALWLGNVVPPVAVGVIDLLFVPALAFMVAPALIAARNKRNYPFFGLLTLLFAGNALMQAALADLISPDLGRRGQFLALDIFLLMIALIGGRIVPIFTANYLRQTGAAQSIAARPIVVRPWLDRATLVAMAAIVVADLVLGDRHVIVGVVCLVAGAVNLLRLSGWRGRATLAEMSLGVLHLGYAWLAVGLLLRGIDIIWEPFSGAAALHALTIGAIGTMTVGVMTRAMLGHTGRPLRATPRLLLVYGLISLAALLRVLGGVFATLDYAVMLELAGASWAAAYLVFLSVIGPMAWRPRADGRPD
jgi:uncharacterized protein involved in response to NO